MPNKDTVVARWHKSVTVNATVVGSIPIPVNEILISLHYLGGKARRWVPTLNTQCVQNSVEIGKQNVLTQAFQFRFIYITMRSKNYIFWFSIPLYV